jgi:hypothetical protein
MDFGALRHETLNYPDSDAFPLFGGLTKGGYPVILAPHVL